VKFYFSTFPVTDICRLS